MQPVSRGATPRGADHIKVSSKNAFLLNHRHTRTKSKMFPGARAKARVARKFGIRAFIRINDGIYYTRDHLADLL